MDRLNFDPPPRLPLRTRLYLRWLGLVWRYRCGHRRWVRRGRPLRRLD